MDKSIVSPFLTHEQLQRERRPQTATTWQAWYRNELIQIWWRNTVQRLTGFGP